MKRNAAVNAIEYFYLQIRTIEQFVRVIEWYYYQIGADIIVAKESTSGKDKIYRIAIFEKDRRAVLVQIENNAEIKKRCMIDPLPNKEITDSLS